MRPRTSSSCARSSCARPTWSPSAWSLSTSSPSSAASRSSSSASMTSLVGRVAFAGAVSVVPRRRERRGFCASGLAQRGAEPSRPPSGHPSPWWTCRRRSAPWRPSPAAALPVCFVTRPDVRGKVRPAERGIDLDRQARLPTSGSIGVDRADLGGPIERRQRFDEGGRRGLGVRRSRPCSGLGDVRLCGASTRGEHLAAAGRLPDALET